MAAGPEARSVAHRSAERWAGWLLWQPGLLSYLGPGGSSARHSHHAIQLAVSFDGPFELRLDDRRMLARAALIPSREPHAFETSDRRIFYALVEPLGNRGTGLARRARELLGRDLADLIPLATEPAPERYSLVSYADRLVCSLTADRLVCSLTADRLVCSLTAPCLTPPLSPHVISALAYLDSGLHGRPRLDEAARAACISPSRLTHLFSQQVGIPFRRFVLWLRLRRAAEHAWAGSSLTEAAIAAGFSDLPHLTRVCKSTFGVTPAAILQMRLLPEPQGSPA
jgi:AraC-like DNA-binding protein